MNNCINGTYGCGMKNGGSASGVAFGERLIALLCLAIAFLESRLVSTVLRLVGFAILCLGIFFYISGVMSGAFGLVATVLYGACAIALSAFVFRIRASGRE